MRTAAILDAIGAACKRVGPGRLPGADRPFVGAGYAGASGAVVATCLFAATAAALATLESSLPVADPGIALAAAYAVPFVVPAAFAAAALAWRLLPATTPRLGAVAGLLAALLTYLLAVALLAVVLTAAAAASLTGADPVGAPTFALLVGIAAFAWTAWVVLPVGCVGGALYERVGATK